MKVLAVSGRAPPSVFIGYKDASYLCNHYKLNLYMEKCSIRAPFDLLSQRSNWREVLRVNFTKELSNENSKRDLNMIFSLN